MVVQVFSVSCREALLPLKSRQGDRSGLPTDARYYHNCGAAVMGVSICV